MTAVPLDPPNQPTAVRGSRRWLWLVLGFAVVAALMVPVVRGGLFPYYSGDRDEPVYRYQAQMLEEGRLTIPQSQEQFFRPWLSGPADGHLVMAFQPLWPAALAVSDEVAGSMTGALMLVAAAGCIAVYAFAAELLRDRRRACVAAGLFVFSPFALILGGTYLNYAFSCVLGTLLWTCGLRAVRRRSVPDAVAVGVLFGLIMLTRPFDALIFMVPILGWSLVDQSRRDAVRRTAAWSVLGAAPFVVLVVLYNRHVTGALLTFPTAAQSRDAARFGWGWRALTPEFPPIHFTFVKALRSFGRNLGALPTWTIGSYLGAALAAFGGWTWWKRDRAETGLLVGMIFVFPLAYITWWASTLTASGAFIGLGPHYYLPTLVPLCVLTVVGIDAALARVIARRRGLAIGVLVGAALVTTVLFVRPKLDDLRFSTDAERSYSRPVLRAVAALPGPSIVVQERAPYSYVMGEHGVLANPPDLRARNLYAVDRGTSTIDLIRAHPDRQVLRVVRSVESGAPLSSIRPRLVPQHVVAADTLAVYTTVQNRSGEPIVIAYARSGRHRRAYVIDRASRRGMRYRLTWRVSRSGVSLTHGTASRPTIYPRVREESPGDTPVAGRAPPVQLVVGAAFSRSSRRRDVERVEQRYYQRVRNGRVEALTAPEPWTRFGAPVSAWVPINTDGVLDAHLAPEGPHRS